MLVKLIFQGNIFFNISGQNILRRHLSQLGIFCILRLMEEKELGEKDLSYENI